MHGRFALLLSFLLLGCASPPPDDDEEPPPLRPVRIERAFDFDNTGTIAGKVTWDGLIPEVLPLSGNLPTTPEGAFERITKPNPNAPSVNPTTKSVENAVVFLRGIDPKKSRPWDLRPVGVEQHDMQLRILQAGAYSRVGFVQTGDGICMISRDAHFNSLRARGAAFFSVPLALQNFSSTKKLEKKGLVELTSGAGYIWMSAYLFVDDHPYYSRTADGAFAIQNVPPGSYELVCWMPNWNIARHELDPESSHPARISFHPPLEIVRQVTVEAAATAQADFKIAESQFKR